MEPPRAERALRCRPAEPGPGHAKPRIGPSPSPGHGGEEAGAAGPAAAIGHAHVLKVLVADDNVDAADMLALLLGSHGHETRTAYGGASALSLAEQWRPDAALLDIGMPDLDGYEVCLRLRGRPWGGQMLLVACTGWAQPADRGAAEAAGFDVHLLKPVKVDALLELLASRRRVSPEDGP